MEEAAFDFQDWELLQGPDSVLASATADASRGAAAGDDSGGVIKADYFDVNAGSRSPRRSSSSDRDREGESWAEPYSGSRFRDEPSGEALGPAAAGFPRPDSGGIWTPEEEGGQEAPPEMVLEGVGTNGGEGEEKGVCFAGGTEEDDLVVAATQVSGELVSAGDSPNVAVAPESPVEGSNGDGDLGNLHVAEGEEKAGVVWWKLPMEVLKFCVFRIKPVWSISIAAALLGVLMLRRRLSKKKSKIRSIPLKVSLDNKVPQSIVRAAHLNEALSAVKRVPVIRATLPASGVIPWPVVALR